jgi:hypothetical protein
MTKCLTHKWIRVRYSAPVGRCVRQLRVLPPALRGGQRVLDAQWRCEPEATSSREWNDEFGNRILELSHARIEREFIWATELNTQHNGGVARSEGVPTTGIGAFLLPSALCDSNAEVERAVHYLQEMYSLSSKRLRKARRGSAPGRIAHLSTRRAQPMRAPKFHRLSKAVAACVRITHT